MLKPSKRHRRLHIGIISRAGHGYQCPPQSDMVCSPAEVKYHRRVELKDHNASEVMKKHFEELCSQFPEVFLTNNEDIGCTNLITMDNDTGDSLPSTKRPYTLPLKHYDWVQEIESLERAGIIT